MVMVTLTRWDDHGSMVSQEEIDQDVADEVSEAVDLVYVCHNLPAGHRKNAVVSENLYSPSLVAQQNN